MAGQIAKARKNQVSNQTKTNKEWIKAYKGAIQAALPKVMTPDRFMRIMTTAVTTNPKLNACSPESFVGAMLNAAQLGLEPNSPLGQAYLIPYYNRKTGRTEAQFQIGYKGMLSLAYRSKEITSIDAQVVYENDEFDYQLGLEPVLKHRPSLTNRGKPIAYYAYYCTKWGGKSFQVMSKDDIESHARKYSKTFENGPWKTDFDAMAKKTVIKQLLKYAPLSIETQTAFAEDETIKKVDLSVPEAELDLSETQTEYIEADFEEHQEGEAVERPEGDILP